MDYKDINADVERLERDLEELEQCETQTYAGVMRQDSLRNCLNIRANFVGKRIKRSVIHSQTFADGTVSGLYERCEKVIKGTENRL